MATAVIVTGGVLIVASGIVEAFSPLAAGLTCLAGFACFLGVLLRYFRYYLRYYC